MCGMVQYGEDFNPRSLAGATAESVDSSLQPSFQSTLPRGSDDAFMYRVTVGQNFNPRSLAGATGLIGFCSVGSTISIHAPSRERRCVYVQSNSRAEFQSTLPRGSDQNVTGRDFLAAISIHAPSRERRIRCLWRGVIYHFNPRSLAGATY